MWPEADPFPRMAFVRRVGTATRKTTGSPAGSFGLFRLALGRRLDDKLLKVKKERIFVSQFLHADWSRLVRGLDNHELEIEANDPTRVVFADPRLLQMALSQLLDNASKYAEPASPIQLSVAVTVSETIFSVHNRGSYIFPEEGERNFQRFYRSPDSRYRAPGTGIGLTVARQIAEAHLGHVWMESEIQFGTTFYLGLPHINREI